MRTLKLLLLMIVVVAGSLLAQSTVSYSATTANVKGAPDAVHIDLMRWSTDAERDQIVAAWEMRGAGRGGAAGGRGGRGGGRGAAAPAAPAVDVLDAGAPVPAAGGGGGRGRGPVEAPPATPEASLAAALEPMPTVGFLWSSEVAGYAIRYAAKFATPDGGQRIVLITDHRLGQTNEMWTPTSGTASNLGFSVIELHLNAKGEGEGKASLTSKVAPDATAKVPVGDYAALPVVLKDVKVRATK